MVYNLQFAVVREDPIISQYIIKKFNPKKVLMISSGGCIALSLKILFPSISFTLFDLNPMQIDHVQHKILALREDSKNKSLFTIEEDNSLSLNACGKFESLFRSFRNFIFEFICTKEQIKKIFVSKNLKEAELIKEAIYKSKYWPVAFDLFFSDSLLVAMFGKDAIQHAAPGSYPRYFQKQLEKGLNKADFRTNYFLHLVLLGYYINRKDCLPIYLQTDNGLENINFEFNFLNSNLLDIKNIHEFQLIDLSNIFDWMEEKDVFKCLNYLEKNLTPGSVIIFRQLNNNKNYLTDFKTLKNDGELSNKLLDLDKSLFYNKVNIVRKI